MSSTPLQWRRPGLRTLAWALALVATGTLLGFGLNAVSPAGINLQIALSPDTPIVPDATDTGGAPDKPISPSPISGAGVKP